MENKDSLLAPAEGRELMAKENNPSLDEFEIIELDDRLEFFDCCNVNCNCGC